MPLIRLSEMYYIAAECAETVSEGVNYLDQVRSHRGLTSYALDRSMSKDNLAQEIRKEYKKEFWGEGQRFFDLLRNNKKVIREDYLSEVPNEAVEFDWSYYKIVLPVPNHEMEYNENMVQNPEYELH